MNEQAAAPSLTHVIRYAPDVAAALAFYEAAFGLARGFVHPGGDYGEMRTGATVLAFAEEALIESHGLAWSRARPENAAGSTEVSLTVADVDAAYARAVAAGATPRMAPTDMSWGQRLAYVADLNGQFVALGSAHGG